MTPVESVLRPGTSVEAYSRFYVVVGSTIRHHSEARDDVSTAAGFRPRDLAGP
jgi:hypothetical protein